MVTTLSILETNWLLVISSQSPLTLVIEIVNGAATSNGIVKLVEVLRCAAGKIIDPGNVPGNTVPLG